MQRLITQFFAPNVRALLNRNGQVISGAGVGGFSGLDEEYKEHRRQDRCRNLKLFTLHD
jgi:hypothetical protein